MIMSFWKTWQFINLDWNSFSIFTLIQYALRVSCILNRHNSFSPHLCGIFILKVSSFYFIFQTPILSSLNYFPIPPIFFLLMCFTLKGAMALWNSHFFSAKYNLPFLWVTQGIQGENKVIVFLEIQITYLRNYLTSYFQGSMLI